MQGKNNNERHDTTRAPQVCGPPSLFLTVFVFVFILFFFSLSPHFPAQPISFKPRSGLLAIWLNVCVIKSVQQWLNYSYN